MFLLFTHLISSSGNLNQRIIFKSLSAAISFFYNIDNECVGCHLTKMTNYCQAITSSPISLSTFMKTRLYNREVLCACFWALILFVNNGLFAQHDAFSRSMGNSTTAISNQYSIFNNPAASVFNTANNAVTATEMRHMLQKIAFHQAGVGIQNAKQAFGAAILHTGFTAYRYSRLSIHYGMLLNENMSVAIRLNGHNVLEPDMLGNGYAITPDASLLYQLNQVVSIGIVVDNFLGIHHPFDSEPLEQRMAIGGAWQMSNNVLLSCDIEKPMSHSISFGAGIQWSIMESVYIRTGLRQTPMINALGVGYQTHTTHIDASVSYIPLLGATPSISLTHSW